MATTAILGRGEGRVQPQDLEAETSVLGALLLDQAAITRVLDFLSPEDFYRENNAQIYRAALNLFREGEPIDNVTLAAELEKLGVLERIGGRAHLALIQDAVPTAANVEHYARIVKDKAYKRRLISAGSQVTALGFDDSLDAEEAVNQAQAHVYAISEDKVGSGMERIYDLLKPAMDRIDAQMASGGGVIGIPSGFHDVDRLTNGFKQSDLIVVAGRPSMGKALALDTPIPTPNGWRTMGDLRVGDFVFDDRGFVCTVTFATPVQEGRECYCVLFSDGERIVADADHQWSVLSRRTGGREPDHHSVVLTTREMLESVQSEDDRRWNYSIPVGGPLRYPRADLALDPYLLGRECTHIPRSYQQAAVDQRMALLQGLMDAGGSIDQVGHAEFCSTEKALAEGTHELATGLGLAPRLTQDQAMLGEAGEGPRFRVRWELGARQHPLPDAAGVCRRFVTSIDPVDSVPVRCIQVDSPSHLYLAGRGCVPTHNTSFALNVALHAAVDHKKPVAIFSLEMSKEQLVERMLCEQARIDAQRLHRGTLSDVEYERLAGALGPLGDAPIFIDDAPALDDLTMRLKARQARSREGIELIVLDYMQLMHSRTGNGDANRVQEVSAISRALKSIARELRIPVIAISQLSRAPEARPDKRPILSDLRESGCLSGDTPIYLPDAGACRPIGELIGSPGFRVLALNTATWRFEPKVVCNSFATGRKPIFALTSRLGRRVHATANHRFLSPRGWKRLDQLVIGDRLALQAGMPGRSDVWWDELVSVEPAGDADVFDLTVEDMHNFVAGGIVAHNSIEQDADAVMFLYRDEYYNGPKSEKPGIAEVIIAKHRNGPTGSVELAFRRELTRFENLEKRHTTPQSGG